MDKAAAIADIDSVLNEKLGSSGSVWLAESSALHHACIARWSPPGSTYRQQADRALAQTTTGPTGDRGKAQTVLAGILRALRRDIDADRLRRFEELVHADLFADLLAQAEYLANEKFTRAAAVLAGGVLEEHLRKLCDKHGIATKAQDGSPRKASALNNDLYKPGNVYSNAERAEVEGWQNRRNSAAHGDADFEQKHDQNDIRRMIEGIRSFIVKYPA
jgi:hypothetical protein